jgi:hypothetical protein
MMMQALNYACTTLLGLPDSTKSDLTVVFTKACDQLVENIDQEAFIITEDIVKRSIRLLDFFNMHKLVLSSYSVDPTGTFSEAFEKICEGRPRSTTISAHFSTLPTKALRFMKRAFEVTFSKFNVSKLSTNNLNIEEGIEVFNRLENLELGSVVIERNPKNNLNVKYFVRTSAANIRARPDLGQIILDMGLNLTTVLALLDDTETREQSEATKRLRDVTQDVLPEPKRQKIRRSVTTTSVVQRRDNSLPYTVQSTSYDDTYIATQSDVTAHDVISQRINPQQKSYELHNRTRSSSRDSNASSQMKENTLRLSRKSTSNAPHQMNLRSKSRSTERNVTSKINSKAKNIFRSQSESENETQIDSGRSSARSSIESSEYTATKNKSVVNNLPEKCSNLRKIKPHRKFSPQSKTNTEDESAVYEQTSKRSNTNSAQDDFSDRPRTSDKNKSTHEKAKITLYQGTSDSEDESQTSPIILKKVKFPVETVYQNKNKPQVVSEQEAYSSENEQRESDNNSQKNKAANQTASQKNGRYGKRGPYKKTLLKAAANATSSETEANVSSKPARKRLSKSPDGKDITAREKTTLRTKNFTPPPHQEPSYQLNNKQTKRINSQLHNSSDM